MRKISKLDTKLIIQKMEDGEFVFWGSEPHHHWKRCKYEHLECTVYALCDENDKLKEKIKNMENTISTESEGET